MNFDTTAHTDDIDQAFAASDIHDPEVLEVAQGVALPEMGASNGSIGTSSTCSSSTLLLEHLLLEHLLLEHLLISLR